MTVNSDAAQQPDADTQPVADKPTGAGDPPRLGGHERAGRPELRRGGAGPGPQRRPSREGTFPFTTETIKLHHGATVGAFDRFFDRYRTSFYHVTAVLQKLDLDDGIDLVQEYLQGMLNHAHEVISDGKKEVLAALEAKTGSRDYQIMVPRPERREARIPSFAVRQYLTLFREVDDYLNAVIYAESVGALSWRDRRNLVLNAPRHVTSIAGRFQSVATRLSLRDLQQEASALDALKAIVGQAESLPAVQASRPLSLGQSADESEPPAASVRIPVEVAATPVAALDGAGLTDPEARVTRRRKSATAAGPEAGPPAIDAGRW
jgi:hypothetical protein